MMAGTEVGVSAKSDDGNGITAGSEEERIRNSDPAVPTVVSHSNKGIEIIDLGQEFGTTSSNLSEHERMPPRIPASITLHRVTSILRLDLSRNKLAYLPKKLFGGETALGSPSCPMLEYLDVGRNRLKELPAAIGNCRRLKTLIVLSNKIKPSGFPLDAIMSLSSLETLDLRWNHKMNNQSSRKRLTEVFPEGGSENQPNVKLLLSHSTTTQDHVQKLSACDRDANVLRSQLEPLSTPQLRKRLHRTFGVTFQDSDESAYSRENIMQQLLQCYYHGNGRARDASGNPLPKRTVRYERGVPLDPTLLKELLNEMEAIRWPRTTRERPKIAAQGYVILQRPPRETAMNTENNSNNNNKAKREAQKLKRFIGIWKKAVEAIESVDEEFSRQFTALAVTKNFTGSPHIDTLNIAPFYGLSLGDFSNGGKLCVECSATCVAEIDTKGRFAKVDGRFCHWVSDYEGTRYSLIYYVTHGKVVPQTTAIFKPTFGATGAHVAEEKDNYLMEWVPPPVFVP